MNWNAISAISEAAGSVAVMMSVVYLAVQVRKQTHESRFAATRELAAQFQDALKEIVDNAEFADIWLKAVQDYDGLPNVERVRVALFLQRVCRIIEQQYLHTRRKHVDTAYLDSIDLGFREVLTFPGTQRWWVLNREYFAIGFRQRVDEMIREAARHGYRSSFKAADSAPIGA